MIPQYRNHTEQDLALLLACGAITPKKAALELEWNELGRRQLLRDLAARYTPDGREIPGMVHTAGGFR
ncbi:MAG: hypothetical protein BGO57_13270 [Sphingomonadales bacterium 63-6]|mgnify:CR=1 FL=1|nr:MAG: hypothetical protein BGO57_13270 [Sphingomonadales bacterium 63-6]